MLKNRIRQPLPPEIAQQSTLLSAWAVLIYRLLEYRGLDALQIFTAAGVDLNLLNDPGARIPHHQIGKVWQRAAELTGDCTLGLDAAQVIFPGMYHSLSMGMSAAPNLLTLLEYFARYRRIFHPLSRMQLVETAEGYQFIWGPREPYVSLLGAEAIIASLLAMCRQLSSPDFAPSSVLIKRQLNDVENARYQAFFQAPVSDGQQENALLFDRRRLKEPLLTGNPLLVRLGIQATQEYIGSLDQEEISNTVYCKIIEALPSQAHSEAQIAEDLHLSTRTLQRKLQEEGTSYDQLLQETRKELALGYMNNPELTIQEVSYLLGFSKATNFSRAFKRWTGLSPTHYREQRYS